MATNCICCGNPGSYSIRLAIGPHGHRSTERYYLPNKFARENHADIEERSFCQAHMRAIEDGLRATISYFQAENGVEPLKWNGS